MILQFYQVTIVVTDGFLIKKVKTLKFIGCIFANWHSTYGHVTISGIKEELLYENVTVQNLTQLNSIGQSDVNVITFRNCAFLDNSISSGEFIYFVNFNKTVMDGCSFTNNSFNSSVAMSIIVQVDSEVLIVNCRFEGNTIGNTYFIQVRYCQGILRIEQTSFTSNQYMASGSINGALIYQPICLNHIISYVNFSHNTLPLIAADAYDSSSSHTGNSSWSNLQLRYNTANTSHIIVSPNRGEFMMTLTLNDLIVIGNKIHNPYYQQGIIFLSNCHVYVSDSQFSHNMATALGISGGTITSNGNTTFQFNNAIHGGGMYFKNVNSISGNGTISFHKNTAQYGGAIYGGSSSGNDCGFQGIQESDHQKLTIELADNSAGNFNGPNVYMHCNVCSSPWYENISNFITVTVHDDDASPVLVSYPNKITSTDEKGTVIIYPGKEIVLNLLVQDCQGTDVSYFTDIFLECENNNQCDPNLLSLHGPSSLSLSSGTLHTGLHIQTSLQPIKRENFKLRFINRDTQGQNLLDNIAVDITLTDCPPGMNFSNGICNCNVFKSDLFLCSATSGELCIERSYWFGVKKGTTITYTKPCPYCDHSVNAQPCGIADTSKYKSVNYSNPDTQCLEGRSGTLCMYCSEDYHETYNTVNCIPHRQCKSWHKWMLLFLTLVLNILIGVGLIVIIRKAFSIGVGYLYGPFFYLAALTQITPSAGDYGQLSQSIDGFAMVYFLEYKILGRAPFCFFNKMNRLYSIALQFVNPLMLLVIIYSFIWLARCRPNISRSMFPQPVQSMSVLLLVACWSLAKTSVQILLYTRIHEHGSNSSNLRVFYHPDLDYFTHEHVPLAIISVFILFILFLHLLLLMVVSQFYSFHRLKPFVDAFQSCYQDKYRWYSVVYALSVMFITLAMVFGQTSLVQCVVLFATVAQCLLQPYRKKWLNVVDTLLLLNLTAIIFFVLQDSYNQTLVLILVSIPLSYIAMGTLVLLIYCSGLHHRLLLRYTSLALVKDSVKTFSKATMEKMRQAILSKSSNSSTPSRVSRFGSLNAEQHGEEATREREPLIGIIQES